MHSTVSIVLLILAAVAFLLAAVIPVPHPAAAYRVQLVAAGLCLWVVETLLIVARVT